jgi:hypothetical protein
VVGLGAALTTTVFFGYTTVGLALTVILTPDFDTSLFLGGAPPADLVPFANAFLKDDLFVEYFFSSCLSMHSFNSGRTSDKAISFLAISRYASCSVFDVCAKVFLSAWKKSADCYIFKLS